MISVVALAPLLRAQVEPIVIDAKGIVRLVECAQKGEFAYLTRERTVVLKTLAGKTIATLPVPPKMEPLRAVAKSLELCPQDVPAPPAPGGFRTTRYRPVATGRHMFWHYFDSLTFLNPNGVLTVSGIDGFSAVGASEDGDCVSVVRVPFSAPQLSVYRLESWDWRQESVVRTPQTSSGCFAVVLNRFNDLRFIGNGFVAYLAVPYKGSFEEGQKVPPLDLTRLCLDTPHGKAFSEATLVAVRLADGRAVPSVKFKVTDSGERGGPNFGSLSVAGDHLLIGTSEHVVVVSFERLLRGF